MKRNSNLWHLELKCRHDKDSHKDETGVQITETQKTALRDVVRTNPLCLAKAARRATQNLEPGARISPEKMHGVRKIVRESRKELLKDKVSVENMTGTYQDLDAFAARYNVALAVRNHNDAKKPIGLHDFFVLSVHARQGEDLHLTFTTPHMLFNWCRALNSGNPVCLRMDTTYKINRFHMCAVVMGFGSLGGIYNHMVGALASNENEAAYTETFVAAQRALLMFMNNLRLCNEPGCEVCPDIRVIKAEPKMIQYLASRQCRLEGRIVVDKANGDNQDMGANFARRELRISYEQCCAHLTRIAFKKNLNRDKFHDCPPQGTLDNRAWRFRQCAYQQ